MIRRLHRFLRPVDPYRRVSGACASGAAVIGHWSDTSEERNLCNRRNLRMKSDCIRVYSRPFAVGRLSASICVHPRLSLGRRSGGERSEARL